MDRRDDPSFGDTDEEIRAALVTEFSDAELRQLAILHVFGENVSVDVLVAMGSPEQRWVCPELKGIQLDSAIALLKRAAQRGLIVVDADGRFTKPPARAALFASLFDEQVSRRSVTAEAKTDWRGTLAKRAFDEAIDK